MAQGVSFYKVFTLGLPVFLLTLGSTGSVLAQPPDVKTVNNVTFVSGGIGDESMAEITNLESQFDLKLFLVSKSGTYLSDIGVSITDPQDKLVLQTTCDGPVLLANLPSGAYTVKATKNGNTVVQILNVAPGRLRTVYLRFPDE